MIYYFATAPHFYTIGSFLRTWGRELGTRIELVSYRALLEGYGLPQREAAFVFSDLDRLAAYREARQRMGKLRHHLAQQCGAVCLNDPARTLTRFELLRRLHELGINRFNAYRLGGGEAPRRYPVFLREDAGSSEHRPALLRDAAELETAAKALPAQESAGMLAVEYCETAAGEGIYRKYGAFVIGEHIIARHLFFSRNWVVKLADLDDPALLAEELAYVQGERPEFALLREVCRMAHIGYGRIDYSLVDGRPQIWEINTNPMIASEISSAIPGRRPAHLTFVARYARALAALDARACAPAREGRR